MGPWRGPKRREAYWQPLETEMRSFKPRDPMRAFMIRRARQMRRPTYKFPDATIRDAVVYVRTFCCLNSLIME